MKGYKGFDKDLKCLGMQYAIGETFTHSGTLSMCRSGLHFVEHPLDALTYYEPGSSRYAEVEAEDVSDQTESDSKRVAKSLRLTAELKLPALVKAAASFVFAKKDATTGNCSPAATTGTWSHAATTGNCSHAATTGHYSHAATTGNCSPAATTGTWSHAATTGNCSHAATTGNCSPAATTGNYAHAATTGNCSPAATTGNYSHAATTGNYAHAATTGKESISASLGRNGSAKGPIGGWLVLSEIDDSPKIKAVGVARVDGKKIKADTFYQIKRGKFVEVQ